MNPYFAQVVRIAKPAALQPLRGVLRVVAPLAAFVAIAPIAYAQPQESQLHRFNVTTVAEGLRNPWGLAFLGVGAMLVTERPGTMRVVGRDGKAGAPLKGVPEVVAGGQGGLLDVVADSNFPANKTLYFCYSEPDQVNKSSGASSTAVARATLADGALANVKVIFRQMPKVASSLHFGCRIVEARDGHLFITLGDRYGRMQEAQTLTTHHGKVVRITKDGAVPPDNPFRTSAVPEVWSIGHRNMQGAALHPVSGKLWTHEHGARGGDEINIPQAGKNYGWPVITHGVDYSGAKIGEGITAKDGLEQPVLHWTPSIAPSGMAFYIGDKFPKWKNHLFVGALRGQMLVRLETDGEKTVKEERLLSNLGERIRDVRNGPDGELYLLTDSPNGRILRLDPR